MPRTNEEIDKINAYRKENSVEGELPYETEGAQQPEKKESTQETTEQIEQRERIEKETADKIKADADLILQEANRIAKEKEDAAKVAQQKIQQEQADKDALELEKQKRMEMSDEDLKILLKNRGIEVEDLSQLKPVKSEAVLAQEKEQRESNKIAFGLSKGLFTRKEYDAYSADVNDVEEVVFRDFAADQLAENADLKPEELKDMFEERFGLNAEEGTIQRKRGEKEMGVIGRQIINTKHNKILSLDSQFENFESSEKQRSTDENKLLASAPVYKNDVNDIFDKIKTIDIDLGDGHIYQANIDPEVLGELKSRHLVTEFAAAQIKAGWDKNAMKASAELAALKQNLNHIVKQVADKYHLAIAAGTHGIVLPGGPELKEQPRVLSEELQDELDRKLGKGKYAEQA